MSRFGTFCKFYIFGFCVTLTRIITFLNKFQGKRQVVVVILISGGLALFTYKSVQFDLAGFLLVELAAACSGARWALSQFLMQKDEMGKLSRYFLLIYRAVISLSNLKVVLILNRVKFWCVRWAINRKIPQLEVLIKTSFSLNFQHFI